MPIIKRFDINLYGGGFEEMDEHFPFFDPNHVEEKEMLFEEKTTPKIPFWKKWWTILKSISPKN